MQHLQPAFPTLSDMVGARIEYIHAEPYQQQPIVTTGTIKSVKELRDGRLEMFVQPDNTRFLAKYRIGETHLLRYLHSTNNNGSKKAIA
jgi:hypothetical protein